MVRTYVITGSASGIGLATADYLQVQGHTVVGIDLKDADIVADLTKAEDRAGLAEAVAAVAPQGIDAVIANAGLALPIPATVAVNYYGAVATLENLRPMLAQSTAPRAVAVTSMASLMPYDEALVTLQLEGTESESLARAQDLAQETETANLIYASTKVALSRWVRRQAATADWAGKSIALNAVAPGVIVTPMTADLLATEESRDSLAQMVPMPLNGFAEPVAVASLLAWLTSEEASHVCGQVVFVDGGSDVVIRGDSTF